MNLDPILKYLFCHKTIENIYQMEVDLKISSQELLQKIQYFQNEGFKIDSQLTILDPLPYKIIPEKFYSYIDVQELPEILFVPQTESTNTLAKKIIKDRQNPVVLLTREQISGRGRMNRTWQMTYDCDIAMSFIVPCELSHNLFFSIIRMASLSVLEILEDYAPENFNIKWPNDIIAKNGKKICGILTESIVEQGQIKYLIIGLGINVNSENLPDYATSLKEIINEEVDINYLYAKLIQKLFQYWKEFPLNNEFIKMKWENSLAWLNQHIELLYKDQVYQGIFEKVGDDGSLQLCIDNKSHVFLVGDLSFCKLRNKK